METTSDLLSINCNAKWKLLGEAEYCTPLFQDFIVAL